MTRFEVVRKAILADAGPITKTAVVLALVGLASLPGIALSGVSGPVPFVPFAPYCPAVMLAALFLNWRWAIGAMFVSMAVAGALFLTPALGGWLTFQLWLRFILFAFACLVLIVAGDTLRRVVRQMEMLARERNLLADEMQHRVQNTLAIVDAMVMLGSRERGVEQFCRDLSDRIKALARANQLVLRQRGDEDCDVTQLVVSATEPFDTGGAFTYLGPEARLSGDASHYLILILHELSTNALKHGALSVPEGTVQICWTGGDDQFDLEWREIDGPQVREPRKHGLGMRLLNSQTVFDATIDFQPDGLVCNLRSDGVLPTSEGVTAIGTQEPRLVSASQPQPTIHTGR